MSLLKFSPNLFLEAIELNRFKSFIDDEGFRKNVLENSVSFGLIKSNLDITFPNGLVQTDSDVTTGGMTFKSVKYNELFAIDSYGNFIHANPGRSLAIPDDNNWHWIRISYQTTINEAGTFSLAADGTLTGSNASLTTTLRGMPNFPSRVRFPNSILNTGEYDILQVTNDNLAILNDVTFQPEDNLTLAVVGTFTPGASVQNQDKYPFQYDDCLVELVPEVLQNTRPTDGYVQGRHYYIARVKVSGSDLIIQDKRIDYWETKGSDLAQSIDRSITTSVGVEAIYWDSVLSPQETNIVDVFWGMRTANWSVDSSRNILTLISATGGRYKSVNDFVDGDFNGWRAYTANGKYSRITNSVKQGSAINLTLDVLDVDNYSADGGQTFYSSIGQGVVVVPDAEEVEIMFTPDPGDLVPVYTKVFTFPINAQVGRCRVLVYKNPSCNYNVQYRYKSFKEYSAYNAIVSDSAGYYAESQFDINGNLISSPVRTPYTTNATAGFITLTLAATAYGRFVDEVYKGDLLGVQEIPSFGTIGNPYALTVGTSKQYQHITGSVTLTNNQTIVLRQDNAVEGNKFVIHFECSQLNLATFNLSIVQALGSGQTNLKTITQGDIYQMMNQSNGIVFECEFSSSGNWLIYQNYDLGMPLDTKILTSPGARSNFDSTGLGQVKGCYGWAIADGSTHNGTTTQNLRDLFIVGYDPTNDDYSTIGATGGIKTNIVTEANIEQFDVNVPITQDHYNRDIVGDAGAPPYGPNGPSPGIDNLVAVIGSTTPTPLENRPPYYVVLYAQKLY